MVLSSSIDLDLYFLVAHMNKQVHEVYFTSLDYQKLRTFQDRQDHTPQQLLLVAKAFFMRGDYQKCMTALVKIQPDHSSKVLYQRQSLLFRAIFLDNRMQQSSKQLIKQLQQTVQIFHKNKGKVKGPPMRPIHQRKFKQFETMITLISNIMLLDVKVSRDLIREQVKAQKSRKKFEGFPCYLLSTGWDLDLIAFLRGDRSKMYPITNYAIINDIFETEQCEPKQAHKNVHYFKGADYIVVSKQYWKTLHTLFNQDDEFGAIKRIFRSQDSGEQLRGSYNNPYSYASDSYNKNGYNPLKSTNGFSQNNNSSYAQKQKFFQLMPVPVMFQDQITVYNLNPYKTLEAQLLPILQNKTDMGFMALQLPQKPIKMIETNNKLQRVVLGQQHVYTYMKVQPPQGISKQNYLPLIRFNKQPLDKANFNKKQLGLKGLQNCGNSCYMGSSLQCLSFIRELVQYLTTRRLVYDIDFSRSQGLIVHALADVFKNLWADNKQKSVQVHKFKQYFGNKNSNFSGGNQQDAHQYLLCLLNNIHQQLRTGKQDQSRFFSSNLKNTTKQEDVWRYFEGKQLRMNKSIVMDLIRGVMHSTITCQDCNTLSHSYDVFLTLQLPISQKNDPYLMLYFLPWKGLRTSKYQVYTQNIKNAVDLLGVLKKQAFQGDSQNYVYIMLFIEKEDLSTSRYQIVFSQMEGVVPKTIQQLKKQSQKYYLVLYEVKKKDYADQVLSVIELKSHRSKWLGFPRLAYLEQNDFLSKDINRQKTVVMDVDNQNRYVRQDIQQVLVSLAKYEQQIKGAYVAILKVMFKYDMILFKGSDFVDKQINQKQQTYTLDSCLQLMRAPEIMQNIWKCGNCGSRRRSQKRQKIVSVGQILIIHLKRFKADYQKIKNMVQYPIQGLDISKWLQKQQNGKDIYDLYAICLHSGSAQIGHYRAFCKHFVSGKWYLFDDSIVRQAEKDQLVTQNAYMLFYRKRS